MVELCLEGKKNFLNNVAFKTIYCFGAGKLFSRFCSDFSEIKIHGVIDNYLSESQHHVVVNEIRIPRISLSEYESIYDGKSILVITAGAYEEIIQQLDSLPTFNGMQCYMYLFLCQQMDNNRCSSLLSWIKNGRQVQDKFAELNKPAVIKRFQIWNCLPDYMTAGSKAMEDIRKIAGKMGYHEIDIHLLLGDTDSDAKAWTVARNKIEWEKCYETIPQDSVLLLQHPTWQMQRARTETLRKLKSEKSVKIVSVMHDVESLRKVYDDSVKQEEFSIIFEVSDVFIVHTEAMKKFFLTAGVEDDRVVTLGIFDYLTDSVIQRNFDKSVIIAGNLDGVKSPYIKELSALQNVKINLFGAGYTPKKDDKNIIYNGAFPMEKIAQSLYGGFGLVWDGDRLDTCGGYTGQYLRFNSPHKCSLFLAAGLPVIIWKEAALAEFVREHNLGITIDSLYELPEILESITEKGYNEYLSKVLPISKMLREGTNTKRALQAAEIYLGV